jgi:hypothetical protein
LQMNKLFSSSARELAAEKPDDDEEVDVDVDDGLRPIPPPNNPPMEKITLVLKQPDLKTLRMTGVDPANTNIRMIREFLEQKYYQGNVIPRSEQRQLLYRFKPIFDLMEGDYNIDDAKTLADHGIIKDEDVIDLSKMHVYIIAPSTKQSMLINNLDPMNDVIFDMRKLALEDGYPIEKLRVLHKEANNREIKKTQNTSTFFNCGVKHQHTLLLEWPKIVIKVKLPIVVSSRDGREEEELEEGQEIIEDPASGRKFKLVDFTSQTELDKVQMIHDFILEQTGIPPEEQVLLYNPTTASGKKSKKLKEMSQPEKVIAEHKIQENDIIELKPMTLKINLVGGPDGPKQTILEHVYPNDTVESIKGAIENGKGGANGIPSIPKTNQSITKTKDGKELKRDQQRLFKAGVEDGAELDVEKTK